MMKKSTNAPADLTRRRLLGRIGLAAGTAYLAPTMIGLNAAHASEASSGNSGASRGGNSGASRGGNSGASRGGNSGASRGGNSGASRPGRGASRGRGRGRDDDLPGWLRNLVEG